MSKVNLSVLVVGANSEYAIERFYVKHLRENDVVCSEFWAQDIFLNYYNKSLINKIFFKLGLSSIINEINYDLISKWRKIKPDIILIFKGMEILPSTLLMFKSNGTKLVNYNPDHPFKYHSIGSGNINVKDGIKYYDCYITYSKRIQKDLDKKFDVYTSCIPFGYDQRLDNILFESYEVNKACFIGSPDKHRASIIQNLVDNSIPVVVYGNNWAKWLKYSKTLEIRDAVYDLEYYKTLVRYRVQLNLLRPHNIDSHNMRSMEIPSVGGIMLTEKTKEHKLFFNEDKEAFFYDSVAEIKYKIRKILALNSDDANEIRKSALNRTRDSQYSYNYRTLDLKYLMESL